MAQFRLIGYENRIMAHRDFNDDTKDAGEIGAGHHVTALYEIVPTEQSRCRRQAVAESRPAICDPVDKAKDTEPLLIVKLRYKKPSEETSRLIEHKVIDHNLDFGHASDDLKFAAAVAGFGMLLRDSPYKGSLTYDGVLEIAQPALQNDPSGYRREFIELVRKGKGPEWGGCAVKWIVYSLIAHVRTCPSPTTIHLVLVSSRRPHGPRAWILSVLMPISAPRPSWPPSLNRVLALTITAELSTSLTNRCEAARSLVTIASVWPEP